MSDDVAQRRSTAVYNPRMLAKDELIATFAAREPLLDSMVDDLRRGAHQHFLIVGQRGAGKTTLLLRLACAIGDDAVLRKRAMALTFPEEQYNVHRVSDLWLNCVDALIDALERAGDAAAVKRLDDEVARIDDEEELDEAERARRGLALLTGWAKKAKRDLVLLIDNLDLILDRLRDWHWALRDTLSEDNRLILVGGSSTHVQETFTYQSPFYDFFKVHELGALDATEARTMLLRLAPTTDAPERVKAALDEPGRFEALHLFSGGMPRTMILLLRLLATEHTTRAEDDLERLLDQVTPYYKARFEELPAQSQVVVDALALHYDPMTAAECAKKTGLEVTLVSAQLSRLVKQGVVSKLPSADSSKLLFLVSERLFAIWYAMRTSRRLRRQLVGFVRALDAFYGHAVIERRAEELLSVGEGLDAARDPARLLAFASVVADPRVRQRLEFRAVQMLCSAPSSVLSEWLDLEGEDRHLVPVLERTRTLEAIRARIHGARGSALSAAARRKLADEITANVSRATKDKLQAITRIESGEWSDDDTKLFATDPVGKRLPTLRAAVGRGEAPSLLDVTCAEDVNAIVAQVDEEHVPATLAFMVGCNAGSVPDSVVQRVLELHDELIISFVYTAGLLSENSDRDAGRAALEQALRWARPARHARWLGVAGTWKPFVRSGRAAETARVLFACGWHVHVIHLYEALKAAGDGRRGELTYLAPEVRQPTEEILASWFTEDVPTRENQRRTGYALTASGTSRAAEAKRPRKRRT